MTVETSIPPYLPPKVVEELTVLNADFNDGLLTEKGYTKKRNQILESTSTFVPSHQSKPSMLQTMFSENSFNFQDQPTSPEVAQDEDQGQKVLQKPLDPRQMPEQSHLERFDSLPSILRLRASTYQKEVAMMVVDSKGKEANTITWEKLYLKAEKISQNIKNKSGLYRGDRVCLIYQSHEIIEFTVALMGCFLAGVVAVPISIGLPVKKFIKIMNDTQVHLCLMSDHVAKHFDKINQNSQNKIQWPKGVEWWKTMDMGSYQPPNKKADPPALHVPDLAYIEFSKSPTGELRGVVLSHRTIMHQMSCLVHILASRPGFKSSDVKRSEITFTRTKNVILSTIDPRQSIGLIIGILFTVFSGNTLIWMPQTSMETPGLYANVITRYKISTLLSDYLGLKQVTYNYQSFPQLTRTFNKKIKVDLSCVKWCLINALTIDSEFHDLLTDRWFIPLGCKDAKKVIAPMLTLSEHGGMVISMRDWIGKEDRLGCSFNNLNPDGSKHPMNSSNLSEVFIDKDSLMTNSVKIVNDRPPPVSTESSSHESAKYIRVGAFGYPLPDATLSIINPETNMLSGVMEVGEIWIDSPSLSGGFWGLSKYTEAIFHARCKDYEGTLDLEFLRTGLLGFQYNGKIYVLGLYEDRLRQRVTWIDKILDSKGNQSSVTSHYRYHYASHLVRTLARNVRQVSDCSFFDIFINKEYLPVAVIESPEAKTESTMATPRVNELDLTVLDTLCTRLISALEKYHNVRLYCVLVTPPDTLPRTIRSGRSEIANMLCKRKFNEGTLPSMYVKFNIKRSISNISRGKDLSGGIWSQYISNLRADSLNLATETQYSGLDYRDVSIDDRTKTPVTDFKTLVDILKWRASHQLDELAFAVIDRSMKETKQLTWKKFDTKVSALCCYIIEKSRFRAGDHIILMYSLSEDFIVACFACFMVGLIPIPITPIDVGSRLNEDIQALLGVLTDFSVNCIFTHPEVETILKSKAVSHAMKNSNRVLPKIKNTAKYNKPSMTSANLASKISKWQAAFDFRNEKTTSIIWLYWTPDHYRVGAKLTHKTLMSMCKVVKETCLMKSNHPLLGCVRHVSGLGFLQSTVMGVFLGSSTYLISPVDYYYNPSNFFLTASRYKIKDTYVTPQMLKHALGKIKLKGFDLSELKNLMISSDGRPSLELMNSIKILFAPVGLSTSAISNVYSTDFNPMITTRSYMAFEPIELWLDPVALRQGYISIVNPGNVKDAVRVQDSGMVPVCTQIAIVNPETCNLCKVGEYGEIWVCSEASVFSFTNGPRGKQDSFISSRFTAKIKNGNPEYTYLRTGDLGFLHNLAPTASGSSMDIQPLFILGKIQETIEVMGLHHFVTDVERTVESCHSNIYKNGTCLFKCGEYTILVVESKISTNLSALVPIIVNKVLSHHSLIIDIVAFTEQGTFPLSRLGEKQRAKMVGQWVQNKLPLSKSYGINYGENYMIKLISEIENVIKDGDSLNGLLLTNTNPDTEVSSELSVTNTSYNQVERLISPAA